MNQDNDINKISKFEVIAYGFGGFASTLGTVFVSSYATFYMTDYVGFSAGIVGIIMMIITLWDAINDPIIGSMADRNHSKIGKYRPYLLAGGLSMPVLTLMRFINPSFGETGNILYFFIVMALWSVSFTAFTVPWQGLNAIIAKDVKQRNTLLTSRQLLGFISAAIATAVTLPIVNYFGGGEKGYFMVAFIFGIMTIICVILTERGVRNVDSPGSIPDPQKMNFKEQLNLIFHNRVVLLAALAFGMHTMAFGIITVSNMYYFTYVMNNSNLMVITGLLGMVGTLSAVLVSGKLINKFGKKSIIIMGLIIMSSRSVAIIFFGNSLSSIAVIILTIISTAGNAIANFAILSLIPDCIDYTEFKFGSANAGFINASITFMQKFAGAFASLIPGLLLDAAGYGKNVINNNIINAILVNVSWVPLICAIVAGVIILSYPLNEKEHLKVQLALKEIKNN